MMLSIRRVFLISFIFIICILSFSVSTYATFGVSPMLIRANIPAQGYTFSIKVSNGSTSPTKFVITPTGLKIDPMGAIGAKESKMDLESAANIFIPDAGEFILPAGEQKNINIKVTPPPNAQGGIYGTILVTEMPPETEGANVVNVGRIAVGVLLTLPGPSTKSGEVTSINVSQKKSGEPVEIKGMFKDTGNIHFDVTGRAIIEDKSGKQLAQLSLGKHLVIPPGGDRLFSGNWQSEGLAVGDYTVRAEMQIEDGPAIESSKIFHVVSTDKILQLDGEISDFSVPKVAKNRPINFGVVFYNKSNVELLPEGEIEIKDSDGNIMITIPIVAKEKIIPKSSGELSAVLEKGVPQGEYIAEAIINYGLSQYNEMRTVKDQVKFTVLEKIPVIAGEISKFIVDSIKSGEAVIPQLFFKNTGNTEFTVEGLIELKNSAGKTVGQVPINKIKLAEKEEKRLGGNWSGTLPVGLYKAVVTLIYGGDKMVSGEASFLVK